MVLILRNHQLTIEKLRRLKARFNDLTESLGSCRTLQPIIDIMQGKSERRNNVSVCYWQVFGRGLS